MVLPSAESLPENTEGWFGFSCISVFAVLMTALSWRAGRAANQVVIDDISTRTPLLRGLPKNGAFS